MSPTLTAPRRTSPRPVRASTTRPARAPARRVSGPIGGRVDPNPARRSRLRHAPRDSVALGGRALALVRGLPDHSLIDRLVRGRAWIPVLGVLLAGIVAMQVEILKLGTSLGRALERSTTLQTQNESLQASVAGLADDQRIERIAAGMGMTMPAPASLVFLHVRPGGDVGRAAGNIHVPDSAAFASQLAAQAASLAALTPAAPAVTSATATSTPATSAAPTSTSAPASTGAVASTMGGAAPTSTSPTSTSTTSAAITPAPTTTSAPVSGSPTGSSATGGGAAVGGPAGSGPPNSSQPTSTGGG